MQGKLSLIPFGNTSRISRLRFAEAVIQCNLNGIHLGHWLGTFNAENGIRKVVNDMCRRTNCTVMKYHKVDPFVRYKRFSY